ncbi:MAG: V-type ATP synthase subunit B, partial [Promethearchaeota archaeon]
GIYPPFEVLASISRLMKDSIGKDTTRDDHSDISSQLLASYSSALEVRDLISIVGEDGLNFNQKATLKFGEIFENEFLNQNIDEDRDFNTSFDIGWKALSCIPKNQLFRIHQKYVDKYYKENV